MTAPTIKAKITADTGDFDEGMDKVKRQTTSAGKDITGFGKKVKSHGTKPLDKMGKEVKSTSMQLKSFGKGLVGVGAKMAKWGAGIAAAMGVAAGAIVTGSLRSIKELNTMAQVAGLSVSELQKGAFAAKSVGLEMSEYADILKDVNDRVGDFIATGGGPMVDFFEKIGPKVGVTADSFRGLNSEQAMGLYVKSLEDANLSQADMTFYMEAMASNATKLIPLFSKNSEQMNKLKKAADELGIGLSGIQVEQAIEAQQQISNIGDIIKNEFMVAVAELAPAITVMARTVIEWFREIRGETGGLAAVMLEFAGSVASSGQTIGAVFSGIGKTVDVIMVMFDSMKIGIQVIMAAVAKYINLFILNPLSNVVRFVQFVGNSFKLGFGEGLTKIFERFKMAVLDSILAPIEAVLETAASLPDMFGGDMFKDALGNISGFRKEVQNTAKALDKEVIEPNLNDDGVLGTMNSIMEGVNKGMSVAKDTTAGFSSEMVDIIGDSTQQMRADVASIFETDSIDVEGAIQSLKSRIAAEQGRSKVAADDKEQTRTDNLQASGTAVETQDVNDLSIVEQFKLETESLMEAMGLRALSEEEILLNKLAREKEILDKNREDKLISEESYEKQLSNLKKSEEEIRMRMTKGNLRDAFSMLVGNSKKAQAFMRKVAIAKAVVAGGESAIQAWRSGMETGGPWAPLVAASYTAASLAKTGSMIASIRAGGKASGGGGAPSVPNVPSESPTANSASTQQSPSRIFNVDFTGDSGTSTQQTRNLLQLINEQAGDNVEINMSGI
jgi:hypothetical protein